MHILSSGHPGDGALQLPIADSLVKRINEKADDDLARVIQVLERGIAKHTHKKRECVTSFSIEIIIVYFRQSISHCLGM